MTNEDLDYHTRQIERHAALARGDDVSASVTPYDYRIPSGPALREMREQCELTIAEVAELVDITEAHLSNVESENSRPSATLVVKFLRLYRHKWPAEGADAP